MIKNLSQELIEAASKVLDGETVEPLNEGANDHEELHKDILKKLHKEHPEIGLNKAEHTSKEKGNGYESHTYVVHHKPSGSHVHDALIKDPKTVVRITHSNHGGLVGSGQNSSITGYVQHEHGSDYGRHTQEVADFRHDGKKLTVRKYPSMVTKEL